MKLLRRNKKAFTLVELLVTIAVIAILATIIVSTGVSVARMMRNNRNKSLTETYFNSVDSALSRINAGTTIYGMNPSMDDLNKLIAEVAGTQPVQCTKLSNPNSNDEYKSLRPNHADKSGYYVGVYYAVKPSDEALGGTVGKATAQWYVEVVYLLSDDNIYCMRRTELGVTVEEIVE